MTRKITIRSIDTVTHDTLKLTGEMSRKNVRVEWSLPLPIGVSMVSA